MEKLVTLFNRVLDLCIAPQFLQSGGTSVHARALVGLILASLVNMMLISLGMIVFYPLTAAGKLLIAQASLATILPTAVALLIVRYTRWRLAATHLFIVSTYLPIVLSIAVTGGIESPAVPLLVWLPIISGFLFSWRLGLCWLGLTIITAIGLNFSPLMGIELVSVVPAENLPALRFAMLICNLVGIGVFIMVFTLINYQLMHELSGQRRKFERLANIDALTALPNRMNFHRKLNVAIQRAKQSNEKVGLLMMDLDKFKQVNDTYGHSVGDELLHHMARRLNEHVRETDFVARLGGDEFVVIMEHVAEPADVALKAASLMEIVDQPYALSVGKLELHASIGAAVYPDQEVEQSELLSRADMAMFYAKSNALGFYMDLLPTTIESFSASLKTSALPRSA